MHRATLMLSLLLLASGAARAQDGYFSTAVLPIAVDSGSFTQEFTFDTITLHGVTVHATFYPGDGTAQKAIGPVACNDVQVREFDGTVIHGLRDWCPALAPGSVFGFLSLQAQPSNDDSYEQVPLFAVRSRIGNPAGAGFNVDAIAAATFGSGQTRVTGLRRLEATESHPAYQSNCFIANLNQIAPGGITTPKRVTYRLSYATSGLQTIVGWPEYNGYVDVVPGQMVRLLDVFAAAGAPAGGIADYMIDFTPTTSYSNRAGIMTFCTVQDNTSYQADLRIGKIFAGGQGMAAEETTMARNQYWKDDVFHRSFAIPPGAAANTHLVYFRGPDTVKCELLSDDWSALGNSFTPPARLSPAAGLEIRMLDAKGLVLGGGTGMTSTGQVFLGERGAWTSARYDGRYLVEVESNGQNAAATRAYSLYCTSGSGNTGGLDIVKYQEAVDRF